MLCSSGGQRMTQGDLKLNGRLQQRTPLWFKCGRFEGTKNAAYDLAAVLMFNDVHRWCNCDAVLYTLVTTRIWLQKMVKYTDGRETLDDTRCTHNGAITVMAASYTKVPTKCFSDLRHRLLRPVAVCLSVRQICRRCCWITVLCNVKRLGLKIILKRSLT
jgi:hypothetical protein